MEGSGWLLTEIMKYLASNITKCDPSDHLDAGLDCYSWVLPIFLTSNKTLLPSQFKTQMYMHKELKSQKPSLGKKNYSEFGPYSAWHVSEWGANEPYWNLPPGGARHLGSPHWVYNRKKSLK